jgi:hypothetical protein
MSICWRRRKGLIGFKLQTLADLIAAVEIRCPVWPPRDAFRVDNKLLL